MDEFQTIHESIEKDVMFRGTRLWVFGHRHFYRFDRLEYEFAIGCDRSNVNLANDRPN